MFGLMKGVDGEKGHTVDCPRTDAYDNGLCDHFNAHEGQEEDEKFLVAVVHGVYSEYKNAWSCSCVECR